MLVCILGYLSGFDSSRRFDLWRQAKNHVRKALFRTKTIFLSDEENFGILYDLLFHFFSTAQSASSVKMYRIQDSTENKSGLYYGKYRDGQWVPAIFFVVMNDYFGS